MITLVDLKWGSMNIKDNMPCHDFDVLDVGCWLGKEQSAAFDA
jgi:hypothetical protein